MLAIGIVRETQSLRMTMGTMKKTGKILPVDSGHEENTLAYKDMKSAYYYIATLFLFSVTLICAIIFPDVKPIFEIVGTISVNFLGFIFPPAFYLKARSMLLNSRNRKLGDIPADDSYLRICSVVQLSLGLIVFSLGMTNSIHGAVEEL